MSKIISGFSSSNSIMLGATRMNLSSSSDTWEIVIRAQVKSNNTQQMISFGTSDYKGFLGRLESKRLRIYMSGNGGSWNIYGPISNDYQFTENEWYYFKFYYDGTYFKVDSSSDGENWENRINNTKTFQMYTNNQPIYLGYRYSSTSEYWRGNINLDECYIKVNNQYIWQGNNLITDGIYNTGCLISSDEGWTNFSTSNYITFGNPFNFGSDSWEMIFKIKTSNNFSRNQQIIGTPTHVDYKDICLCLFTDRKLRLYLGNSGSSWDIAQEISSSTALNVNTEYYIKLIYDTNGYYCYLSTTGEFNGEETQEIFVNNSNPVYYSGNVQSLGYHSWGTGSNDYYIFYGILNLKECIIKQNNNVIFNGSTAIEGTDYNIIGNPMYINENIALNFNSSSYLRLNPIQYNYNGKNAKGIIRAYFVRDNNGQDIICRSYESDIAWYLNPSTNQLQYYSNTTSTTVFKDKTWYWLGYSWDGQIYKFYSIEDNGIYKNYKELPSFDNTIWKLEASVSLTNNIYSTGITIGYNIPVNNSYRYWRGMIDLNNTIIGNNIINYEIGKEGYITKSNILYITENTTKIETLENGIKLTINPTPADAKVLIWANGYKQTKGTNTLTAIEGSKVYYEVNKTGYSSVNDSYILGSSNHTINVTMEESHDWIQPQIYDYGTWGTEGTLSVKTDNGYFSDMYLWKAFNESNDAGWHSSGTGAPFSVYISLGQSVYVSKMSFVNRTNDTNSPWPARGGYLYGSNDGVTFNDIIATWTNDKGSAGQSWSFDVDNSQAYKYLKLYITNASSYCCLKRVYITGQF